MTAVMSIEHFSLHKFFEAVPGGDKWQPHISFVKAPTPITPPPEPVMSIARRILDQHYPGISMGEIKGPSRAGRLVLARWHIYSVIHEERPDVSVAAIGRIFNRDHSTVLHGIRKFRQRAAA